MPALAHIGLGLATKRIAPQIPLWGLIIGSMTIDILSVILFFAPIWTSHSLLMGVIWALFGSFLTAFIMKIRNMPNIRKISIIIGILVFSHTILDLIGWPMFFQASDVTGIPLLFAPTPTFGLGLYKTWYGAIILDFGVLLIGILIYHRTIKRQ